MEEERADRRSVLLKNVQHRLLLLNIEFTMHFLIYFFNNVKIEHAWWKMRAESVVHDDDENCQDSDTV